MLKVEKANLSLYKFKHLSQSEGVDHYISTREGGLSKGDLGGLNLSYKVGDDVQVVKENRKLLAQAMGVEEFRLVFPVQTHSVNIGVVKQDNISQTFEDTDALITNQKEVCISVMSADCVPVLLYDPQQRVVAAIHAGWKGTVGKIVSLTLKQMEREFGVNPSHIVAGIGPSICQQVYQVGPEVVAVFDTVFGKDKGLIKHINEKGKGYVNLWEANRIQLLEAGVRDNNIEVAGICTYLHDDLFFSARKSGNKAGRFAAGIMIEG
jgi:polyphenol oxidase